MNRALLSKELQALKPYAACILALFLVGQIFSLCTDSPDVLRYDPAKWLDKSRSGSLTVLTLFCLVTGAGVLMQERDQGTLLFLDGLPLSRTRVFIIKALAAFLVISLVPLVDIGSDVLVDRLSRNSTDGPFPWRFAATEGALQLLAGLFLLTLSMLLSYTRAWFAMVSGLILWTYLWMRQRGFQWAAWFDPYELIGPAYIDSRVVVSWPHVAAQTAAALGSLVVAWLGFLSLGDRAQFAAQRLGRLRWLAALGAGVRWLAPVIWIAALVRLAGPTSGENERNRDWPVDEEAFSRKQSKHYEFLYRTVQGAAAKPLLDAADQIYQDVQSYLHAPDLPGRVVVDLASPVATHASGQTNWTKIRIPLTDGSDFKFLRLILAHETTHVFIEQLSDGRATAHFNDARFLHEGLATHVELSLFGSEEDRVKIQREIAGAWSRGKVPLEDLANDEELGKTREPYLAYPMGSVFARVLIETQGPEAPARLLRAMARKDAPSGLKGMPFWRDTMQAAGLNLDRVAAAYDAACESAVAQQKEFLASLPKLTATVRVVGEKIVVQPKFEGKPPGEVICFTHSDDPLAAGFELLQKQTDGSFAWPTARSSSARFRYLLGWRTKMTRLPVFEPWAETTLEK